MKKNILLSLVAIAALMVSCKEKEDPTPAGSITAETVEYTIPTEGTEEAEQFIAFTTNAAWTATVKGDWLSITPKKGEAGEGKIKLIAAPNETNDALVATVVVTVEGAVKEFTVTQLQKDAFSLVAESATIGADGGEVELKVMTNVAYDVTIPEDATWIKKAETKAYGEQVTKFVVDAYAETDATRDATLTVTAEGFEPLSFTITQNGLQTKVWSVDMHSVMNRVTGYAPAEGEVAGTSVSLAVWGDKLVVCAGDGSKPVLLDIATGEKKGDLDTGDAKAMYVTNDDAGNLVFCNRVFNYWTSYAFFTDWYMKPGDTAPTKLASTKDEEYYPSYIGAGLAVRGDVTKDAAIIAPWEGAGGYGDNMILGWNVKGGVASNYSQITISGFIGTDWLAGYWMSNPYRYVGYALLGNDLANGGLLSAYEKNTIYAFDGTGAATELHEIYVPYDNGGTIENVSSNYAANCLDYRTINGKDYGVFVLSPLWSWAGSPVITIFDPATKEEVYTAYSPSTYILEDDAPDALTPEVLSTAAAVRLVAAEDGIMLYHINNSCSSIEAYHVVVK